VLLLGIVFDQGSKWIAKNNLEGLLDSPFIGFVYQENRNIAFSIPVPGFLVSVIALLCITFIIVKFHEKLFFINNYTRVFLGLIFAGAIGNILDRCIYGYVIDFIKVGVFPVFNIADSMISLAVILGVLFYKRIFKED